MKKTDIVRKAVSEKDWKTALRYAKGFRIGFTSDESDKITRAYECIVHPEFYRQIGKNIEDCICIGIEIVERRYG